MLTFRTAIVLAIFFVVDTSAYGQVSPSAQRRITPPAGVRAQPAVALNPRVTLRKFQETLSTYRKSALYVGKSVSCTPTSPCNAPAELTELFDSTGKLVSCSVKTGDINLTYGSATPRFIWITWDLTVLNPSNPPADYQFEPENGLLILRNRNGSTGNKADNVSKTQVKLRHKYKIARDEVHYYPLVLQTLPDGTETLCAAGDPKMVND